MVVNGAPRELGGDPQRSLLMALRNELGLTGSKPGCGEGECGACTVLVDGEPLRACRVTVGEVAGSEVTTIEGLGGRHPVQRAFVEMGAMQCGYCTPGMVLTAVALLERDPAPDDHAIDEAMNGNICRCCAYPAIRRAIHRAAEVPLPPPLAAAPPAPEVARRPARPWDLTPAPERDYFAVLGEGLVVVLPPAEPARGFANGGAWCHISPAGTITGFTGKVDVGQDNRTALTQLLAEDSGAALPAVRLIMGDTDVCPFDVGTFGSRSMADIGAYMRSLGAHTRALMIARGAERLGVPPAELDAADGIVRHLPTRQAIGYGDLVQGARRLETVAEIPPPSPASGWVTAGRATSAPESVEAVTGARRYPSDLRRPGMLHGAILRPPALGAQLKNVDLSAASAMPGVTAIQAGALVAVAAPDVPTARRALLAIRAEWRIPPQAAEADLVQHLRTHPTQAAAGGWGGSLHHEAGDVDAAPGMRLSATYTAPYIAHAPLETRAALAEWEGGRLTVWTGTQTPFATRDALAEALAVDAADIRVVVPMPGGGFGGKHTAETAIAAARLARAAGRPVRIVWTRAEEFAWAYFRPATVIDVRSAVSEDGRLTAWSFTTYNAGAAGIHTPYAAASQRIDYVPAESPLPQGSYRALAATVNHFARESHMDEVARALDIDPLEFRLRNLQDERLAAVFRAAAERAGWAGRGPRAMGIAGGVEKDGRVATCVEVHAADGRIVLDRIVTAYECGAIVNPAGLRSQVEGATIMGLGGALFEAVHFADGHILNGSFAEYRVPRFGDVPQIEVVLVNRPEVPPAGAGETPIVAIAPAIANAIFAATGQRIRSLPLL